MSYKFFQNTKCPFFPCHKIEDVSKFNCLMCFCPLYYLKDCGGNYNATNNIKDCSGCILNHIDYDYVMNKIVESSKE